MLGSMVNVKDLGKTSKWKVTAEMIDAVQVYLDEVLATRSALAGATFEVEKRVSLDAWIPGGFGTSDHIALQMFGRAVVHDYKHGAGVAVDAVGNTQMRIYALGSIGVENRSQVETVEMVIVQPRAAHADGPIRRDEMKVEELFAWGHDVLKPGAKRTQDPNAPLTAGSWCRWCDASGVCPEQTRTATKAMFGESPLPVVVDPAKPSPLPAVGTLTPERLAEIYQVSIELVEPWLKSVKAAWTDHLADHGPTCGYKLVAGRSTRKWADPIRAELEATEILKEEDAYEEPKLKSVAQLEKALKAAGKDPKALAHLVEVTRGVSVAREDDKRPALPANAEQMFGSSESEV
jgi:hypothetical protein